MLCCHFCKKQTEQNSVFDIQQNSKTVSVYLNNAFVKSCKWQTLKNKIEFSLQNTCQNDRNFPQPWKCILLHDLISEPPNGG